MKTIEEIILKLNEIEKMKEEVRFCNLDFLVGTHVRLTKEYIKHYKDNEYHMWAKTPAEQEDVDYEMERNSCVILSSKRVSDNDIIIIQVKYPNGVKTNYALKDVEPCNKNKFLKECVD